MKIILFYYFSLGPLPHHGLPPLTAISGVPDAWTSPSSSAVVPELWCGGLSPTEDVSILGGVESLREKNITNFISESHNPDEKIRTGDLFIFIIICFFFKL